MFGGDLVKDKVSELAKTVIEKTNANISESELIALIEEEIRKSSPSSES